MTDDEDENTPRELTDDERRAYLKVYPSKPAIAELVPSPHNMFEALLDQRLDIAERSIASLIASRSFWRRAIAIGLPLLLAAAGALAGWSIDRVIVSSERVGATSAMIGAMAHDIEELKRQVLELRKLGGLEPQHPDASLTYQSAARR